MLSIGPGVDGDPAALVQALSDADDGDIIMLGAGVFVLTRPLEITSDIELIGEAARDTQFVQERNQSVFDVEGASLTLRDLTLMSTYGTEEREPHPLLAAVGATIELSDVVRTGGSRCGARGESNVTIIGSEARDNDSGFIFDDFTIAHVTNSMAIANADTGFGWVRRSTGSASGNIAAGNIFGYYFDGRADPELTMNIAQDNHESGFVFKGAALPTATQNQALSNAYGFSVEDSAAPTLNDNAATDNSEAGFLFRDISAGVLNDATVSGNGAPVIVGARANPEIVGDFPVVEGFGLDEVPTPTPSTCPSGYVVADSARCKRVLGPAQVRCGEGRPTADGCSYDSNPIQRQSCSVPYLLYRADSDDPTTLGGTGTCAWFDNAGSCPPGDVYNPTNAAGAFYTHPCRRAPDVELSCNVGRLVESVCVQTYSGSLSCNAGVLQGRECVEFVARS
ncbi:hypothetical protein GQR58_029638 [Nymphon striatum]|nr:hypothetical protein GQR58_029638 [Nymphon striatum]